MKPWASIFTQDLKLSDKNIWIDMNCGANNQLPPGPTPKDVNNCQDTIIDLNTGRVGQRGNILQLIAIN